MAKKSRSKTRKRTRSIIWFIFFSSGISESWEWWFLLFRFCTTCKIQASEKYIKNNISYKFFWLFVCMKWLFTLTKWIACVKWICIARLELRKGGCWMYICIQLGNTHHIHNKYNANIRVYFFSTYNIYVFLAIFKSTPTMVFIARIPNRNSYQTQNRTHFGSFAAAFLIKYSHNFTNLWIR